MNVRGWAGALALAAAAGGGGAWWAARRAASAERAESARAAAAAAEERAIHARDIAFHAARAARDPDGAADRARLAALYLQRARDADDFEDYLRAEAAARASLARRTRQNGAALGVLASSQLAQHRFAD